MSQTKGRFIAGLANTWQTITTNHTVEYSENLAVLSNDPVTITLPAIPSIGQWVRVLDASGNASTAPIVISADPVNIIGERNNGTSHIINVDNQAVLLVFDGTKWILVSNIELTEAEVTTIAVDNAIQMAIALG